MALTVPPGRAGKAPSLSVAYDSGGGEGTLGVGVSLRGFSSITRCPSNIAQDKHIRGIKYDQLDALCLDGLRLVEVPATSDSVEEIHEYRTFPDTFTKVVGHYPSGWTKANGAQYFEAFTRSGRIVQYGLKLPIQDNDCRTLALNGAVASWSVSVERDHRDNTITYTYVTDNDSGDKHTVQPVPARIDYTGTLNPLASGTRYVQLNYSIETPGHTELFGGMMFQRTKRLDSVQMALIGEAKPLRTYAFAYAASPASTRRLLKTVTECPRGNAAQCKPATRFGWSSTGRGKCGVGSQSRLQRFLVTWWERYTREES